jgi:hypothetical protein
MTARRESPGHMSPDPLIHALVRFVEALHARYPDGPDQLAREGLAGRGNMPVVNDRKRPKTAA